MFPELRRARRALISAPLAPLALVVLSAVVTACDSSEGGGSTPTQTPDASGPGPTGGTPGAGGGGGPVGGDPGTGGAGGSIPDGRFEATRANLRFKGAARIREDFARVLQLPTDALCSELGRYDCIGEIHQIALGGVEPYRANIFVPFPGVAVGAPLAVERVALAACGERVRRDLETPASAVFFGRLPVDGGALTSVDAPEVDAALTRLFREALLREPSREDLAVLKGLYADTVAEGGANPAQAWAQLACMSVLTMTESLLF